MGGQEPVALGYHVNVDLLGIVLTSKRQANSCDQRNLSRLDKGKRTEVKGKTWGVDSRMFTPFTGNPGSLARLLSSKKLMNTPAQEVKAKVWPGGGFLCHKVICLLNFTTSCYTKAL